MKKCGSEISEVIGALAPIILILFAFGACHIV